MKKLTKTQQLSNDCDYLKAENADLNLKLKTAIKDLEVEKKRTARKEKVLKRILDLSSGLFNSCVTDNKTVTFELVGSVSRMAKSEITFIESNKQSF